MSVRVHCPLVPPPSVSLSPPPTGVFTGQPVVLSCAILLDSSVDTPVTVAVQWFNPASTIIASTIASLQSTPSPLTHQTTTTISDFMAGDTGTYSCAVVITSNSSRPLTTRSDSVSASAVVSLSKSLPSHYLMSSLLSLLQPLPPLPLSLLPLLEPHLYHSHGLSLRVTLFPTTWLPPLMSEIALK